jgi:hypothetical protein
MESLISLENELPNNVCEHLLLLSHFFL